MQMGSEAAEDHIQIVAFMCSTYMYYFDLQRPSLASLWSFQASVGYVQVISIHMHFIHVAQNHILWLVLDP